MCNPKIFTTRTSIERHRKAASRERRLAGQFTSKKPAAAANFISRDRNSTAVQARKELISLEQCLAVPARKERFHFLQHPYTRWRKDIFLPAEPTMRSQGGAEAFGYWRNWVNEPGCPWNSRMKSRHQRRFVVLDDEDTGDSTPNASSSEMFFGEVRPGDGGPGDMMPGDAEAAPGGGEAVSCWTFSRISTYKAAASTTSSTTPSWITSSSAYLNKSSSEYSILQQTMIGLGSSDPPALIWLLISLMPPLQSSCFFKTWLIFFLFNGFNTFLLFLRLSQTDSYPTYVTILSTTESPTTTSVAEGRRRKEDERRNRVY